MTGGQKNIQSEFLTRAKELRVTAAQVRDRHAREALIHAADTYERMATLWAESGKQGSSNER
jgi:hypothetical protein